MELTRQPAGAPSSLLEAERSALRTHQQRGAALAATVRLSMVVVFLPLTAALSAWGSPDWGTYVEPLALYAVPVAATFAWRRHPFLRRLIWPSWVLDVALVFWLQHRTMPVSPFPAGVAGFSLGLFTLLITLSASALSRFPPFTTAAVAIVAQVVLMNEAGLSPGTAVAAALVLALTAVVNFSLIVRLRGMVLSLTQSEVKRQVTHERVVALDSAKQTIEQLLEQAQRHNERLLRLQEDKDVLGALLVHDLRAPLGAVRPNLDFARKALPPGADTELQDALGEARQTTDRLASMIGDLLNIAKLEDQALPLERTALAPRALLTGLHKQFAAQARSRSVSVSVEVDDTPDVWADAGLLTRALENLASNALRYTPTRGRLRFEARAEGDVVALAVRNDGVPIPPDARARLFEKFVQAGNATENRRAGWGLGLYFCRLVADAHGGSVCVEDREGWATSFVVRVPVRKAVAVAA